MIMFIPNEPNFFILHIMILMFYFFNVNLRWINILRMNRYITRIFETEFLYGLKLILTYFVRKHFLILH